MVQIPLQRDAVYIDFRLFRCSCRFTIVCSSSICLSPRLLALFAAVLDSVPALLPGLAPDHWALAGLTDFKLFQLASVMHHLLLSLAFSLFLIRVYVSFKLTLFRAFLTEVSCLSLHNRLTSGCLCHFRSFFHRSCRLGQFLHLSLWLYSSNFD